MATISEHCRNLRHLKLDCDVIETSLEPLWTSAGKKLPHLELEGSRYDPKLSLQAIMSNCRNIARLSYGFSGSEGHKAIEELCKLYGPRLVELKVDARNMEPLLL